VTARHPQPPPGAEDGSLVRPRDLRDAGDTVAYCFAQVAVPAHVDRCTGRLDHMLDITEPDEPAPLLTTDPDMASTKHGRYEGQPSRAPAGSIVTASFGMRPANLPVTAAVLPLAGGAMAALRRYTDGNRR
jgi:hypothetical protein